MEYKSSQSYPGITQSKIELRSKRPINLHLCHATYCVVTNYSSIIRLGKVCYHLLALYFSFINPLARSSSSILQVIPLWSIFEFPVTPVIYWWYEQSRWLFFSAFLLFDLIVTIKKSI